VVPSPTPSVLGRAVAAVALTVGFYALALTLAGALIVGPIALWATSGSGNLWATIAALAAGFTILRAVVPARDRFVAPGPELTPSAQPELFAELRRVADAVGEPLPPAIYLDADVNASVAEISDGPLRGRRRIMVLGLPLLASLTPAQMRAVVAHEYGHYVGGDTRFSAWIWRTRVAVLRSVDMLDDEESWFQRVIVRTPFLLYAKMFLRLTNAMSRRAEFAADAVAARVEGADTQAATLRTVSAAAPAYSSYWRDEVLYTLKHGRRPPIAAGFQRFLDDHEIRAQVDEIVAAEIAEGETNPYDSHPTLADRLRAVGAEPTGEITPPAPEDSAAALLRDLEALEVQLLECIYGSEETANLRSIAWEEAGVLYADEGDSLAEEHRQTFAQLTVADVSSAAKPDDGQLAALRATLGADADGANLDQLNGFWRFALGRLVLAALRRDGWDIESVPGQALVCRRGADTLEPYDELERAAQEPRAGDDWVEAPRGSAWRSCGSSRTAPVRTPRSPREAESNTPLRTCCGLPGA
jgi:heat shock protein HtpX